MPYCLSLYKGFWAIKVCQCELASRWNLQTDKQKQTYRQMTE